MWLSRLMCFHSWRHHVAALCKKGEPLTWKVCHICGKTVIEYVATRDDAF
jgi:hypothetical protein